MPHYKLIRNYIVSEECIVEAFNAEVAMFDAIDDKLNLVIINDNSSDYEVYYPNIQLASDSDILKYKAVKAREKK